MILPDVGVLVYAFRDASPDHARYRDWLRERVASHEAFALSDLVLGGVVRILTHPAIFAPPTPLDAAFEFVDALRAQPNAVLVAPGPRHWEIFSRLAVEARAKGNLISDAYHAALAIEHGCEWITTDRDYARFTGLRWRHPLD
jgi:uncharacterized protein